MQQHKESHLDHGLSPQVVDYIMTRFVDRNAFFIETFELPPELGTVPCGLYGPAMGDAPMLAPHDIPRDLVRSDLQVFFQRRGNREYESHVVRAPSRPTRMVTVIAGPHEEHACILYTAFGGPLTPKEPNDPTCAPDKLEESRKFWSEHALAV
jgi:hypothetical protein